MMAEKGHLSSLIICNAMRDARMGSRDSTTRSRDSTMQSRDSTIRSAMLGFEARCYIAS